MLPISELVDTFAQHNIKRLGQALKYCNPAELSILRTTLLIETGVDIYTDNFYDCIDEASIAKIHTFEETHDSLISAVILNEESSTNVAALRRIPFTRIFGVIIFVLGISYIVAITWIPIPPDNIRFADMCSGFILGTVLSTIINFFYGSSSMVGMGPKTIYRQPTTVVTAATTVVDQKKT